MLQPGRLFKRMARSLQDQHRALLETEMYCVAKDGKCDRRNCCMHGRKPGEKWEINENDKTDVVHEKKETQAGTYSGSGS